ncbi:MAG: DUF3572 domain-containing protein [Pseudorhodobacter sp.]
MEWQESAEILALKALGWLAADDELLPVFLGSSGAAQEDLARGAQDPAFLGAVLDFLLLDDDWIVAFCDSAGLPYEAPASARAALPGGAQTHWT